MTQPHVFAPHSCAAGPAATAAAPRRAGAAYTIWLTGLSGAGKSTLAQALAGRLQSLNLAALVLDGDELRRGLNRDLGFSAADRTENIRRAAEVARLIAGTGTIVLAAFISPLRADREMAREVLGAAAMIEIFVDAPLAVTEARDPKGLYRLARQGKIAQFTGIDAPYEAPLDADLVVDTGRDTPAQSVEKVMAWLDAQGWLGVA